MKVVNNPALRSIFAIVLGLILVLWPAATINYLVIVIGVLFLVPGLIAMIGYLMRDKERYPDAAFPIEGAGSALFGLWLIVMPAFFVNILMYVLGALRDSANRIAGFGPPVDAGARFLLRGAGTDPDLRNRHPVRPVQRRRNGVHSVRHYQHGLRDIRFDQRIPVQKAENGITILRRRNFPCVPGAPG